MITLGIIGAGRMAKVHIRSIVTGVSGVRLKAAADPYMTKETEVWLRGMGIEEIYLDYKQILADPQIDAVMICSSTDTHAPISMEAIAAGKHTFCEKPVDQDFTNILPIVDALAKKKHLKYQVGFNRRFDHNFRALRDTVDSGRLGDIHFLRICSRDSVTPPASYVRVSGGIFLDMMIHDIDMIRFLSKSDVEEVYAIGNVLIDQYFADEGDIDTAIVTCKLKNGAMAVIDNSRKAVYGYDQRAEIHGSKGCAEIRNDEKNTILVSTAEGVCGNGPVADTLERYIPAYAAEIASFVKAIEEDRDTEVNVNDGLQSVLIGLACKKSLLENRPVKLSEIVQVGREM